jgi:exosortase A-associated hydrolase 2
MTGTQAFFLPVAGGQRYCLHHPPEGRLRHLVVHIHPFAEELNKTRRMATLQARALAAEGDAVLQIDLLGCGDSSGDFADARWDAWLDDLHGGIQWLRGQHGDEAALWLWGLRAGCLLAADAARSIAPQSHLLFWQPSFADGAQQLQQFLRLRLAADMLAQTDKPTHQVRGAMDMLRERLLQGEALDIAGYTLSPALAQGLQASRLQPPAAATGRRLVWLEATGAPTPALSPMAQRALAQWQDSGWSVQSAAASGPSFWQSTEIEEAPALIEATCIALRTQGAAT